MNSNLTTKQLLGTPYVIMNNANNMYNTDTLLLGNFLVIKKKSKRVLDIGCGSGALMLFAHLKTDADIVGIDIQLSRVKDCQKMIEINQLGHVMRVYEQDVRTYTNQVFDCIIVNPPFFKVNANTKKSVDTSALIARHEITLTLEEVIQHASRLLKHRGSLQMIHRPDRLMEIFSYCEQYGLVVKRIQFVHPFINQDANHVLIEAHKKGMQGVKVLKPLIIYQDKHIFTKEMESIYQGG